MCESRAAQTLRVFKSMKDLQQKYKEILRFFLQITFNKQEAQAKESHTTRDCPNQKNSFEGYTAALTFTRL